MAETHHKDDRAGTKSAEDGGATSDAQSFLHSTCQSFGFTVKFLAATICFVAGVIITVLAVFLTLASYHADVGADERWHLA